MFARMTLRDICNDWFGSLSTSKLKMGSKLLFYIRIVFWIKSPYTNTHLRTHIYSSTIIQGSLVTLVE